mmetsp:Transcript_41665/g.103999  ORF Transcript_41665/g.103999 Transcript_41665/m.103999 type:complete len:207 (-) Transcript_41665:65-685(-)
MYSRVSGLTNRISSTQRLTKPDPKALPSTVEKSSSTTGRPSPARLFSHMYTRALNTRLPPKTTLVKVISSPLPTSVFENSLPFHSAPQMPLTIRAQIDLPGTAMGRPFARALLPGVARGRPAEPSPLRNSSSRARRSRPLRSAKVRGTVAVSAVAALLSFCIRRGRVCGLLTNAFSKRIRRPSQKNTVRTQSSQPKPKSMSCISRS